MQPLTLPKFGEPLDPFPAFTASVANIRPTSRGWVRITSPDPEAHPEIRPNYLSTEDDRRVAADAVRVTRNIVSMPSLAKYQPEEFRPGLEFQSDEDAGARAAGDISTTIFHPVGTTQMGSDDAAVVDPRLKVRGLAGPARRRRLGDADHHLRQHQLADPDDRRKGRGDDPGGRARLAHSSGLEPAINRNTCHPRLAQLPSSGLLARTCSAGPTARAPTTGRWPVGASPTMTPRQPSAPAITPPHERRTQPVLTLPHTNMVVL